MNAMAVLRGSVDSVMGRQRFGRCGRARLLSLPLTALFVFWAFAGSARAAGWSPLQLSLSSKVQLVSADTDVHGLRLAFPFGENRRVDGIDLGIWKTEADGVALQTAVVCSQDDASAGVSVAALCNVGALDGLQVAGIATVTPSGETGESGDRDACGLQLSGVFNASRQLAGFQVAGIANLTEDIAGGQVSGWSNACEHFRGVQLAGISNLGARTMCGLQVGGGVNVARIVQGVQISGLCNWAPDLLAGGGQISAINVTEASRGFQVGGINVAKYHNGVQFGLLNINVNGPIPVFPGVNVGWGVDAPTPEAGAKAGPDKGSFIGTSILAPVVIGVVGLLAFVGGHNFYDSVKHAFNHSF